MNCNYKVKIQDIQTKYKFKVFCTGYDDSEIKQEIENFDKKVGKAIGTVGKLTSTSHNDWLSGNYSSSNGEPQSNNTRVYNPNLIHIKVGDILYLEDYSSYYLAYGLYQSDGTFISGFTSWISSDVIFTEECYIKFEIRRANNGTIAPAQAPAVYVKSYTKDLGNYKINRYLHVSLDDVNSCLKDLIDNSSTYTSLFDNSFLNDLKNIHDMFGTVFTLNTFNTAGTGYNISNMPTNYKNEFAENSNWLRFSFHAKDSSTRYDTSTGTIETDYATFINAIKTFASEKCLDNFIKLGFFTGNADTINLLNSSSYKPIGYFTADDTRLSYYLTQTQTDFINANNYGYDSSKNIYFMKSQTRLENISNVDTWLSNLDILNLDYLEIFTHEHEWDNEIKSKLIKILAFLNDLGYQNDYFNNHFKRQNILS